jgi:ankyrin repeat protein
MPKTSNNRSLPLPPKSSLENLRKQAKSLLRAARANDESARKKFVDFHPSANQPPTLTLSDAQVVIARSYGFASWPKLKQHVTIDNYSAVPDELRDAERSGKPVDRFISLACLNYTNDHRKRRDEARKLLSANPGLSTETIYAAATVGDAQFMKESLLRDRSQANVRGGPYNWEPLLYATYSRLNSTAPGHSTLEVARLLLEFGADPNAGFIWDRNYLFTALTGVFGEGESGPLHQPEHPSCNQLARLLLDAGADPNDGQTLYNRMFTGGTSHLELLFEFGLGEKRNNVWFKRLGDLAGSPEEMLQQQMAWAAKYNQVDRMKLLIAHGVNVNAADTRFHRTPYELAMLNGNDEMAKLLVEHGAVETRLDDLDAFSAACLNSDGVGAKTLLERDPTLIRRLGTERSELLNRAAESNKQKAIRLMVELGFDVNERKRTAPLHLAAAGGNLEMVKLLISLGADPAIRDEEFNATPLGWAQYGEREEVAEFLKSVDSKV